MRKLFFIQILICISISGFGQTYLISTGGSETTCSGDFFDSGGNIGGYAANENFSITFLSNSGTNTHIRISINEFDINMSDSLYVYDGLTTAAPIIGIFNNTNNPAGTAVVASVANASGALTFRFWSNAADESTGWSATISCVQSCQSVLSAIDTLLFSPLPDACGFVDICQGDLIHFAALGSGPGVFPQDGTLYNQDASTSLFIWDFGDGVIDTGQVFIRSYSAARGYNVALKVIDINGCESANEIGVKIRVSGNPVVSIHPPSLICPDTFILSAGLSPSSTVQIVPYAYSSLNNSAMSFDSTMLIPDGPNCAVMCYNTEINVNSFASNQVIENASDIQSICVNIEHSFVGDLGFNIFCPNGQSVLLDQNTHSSGAYLGEPAGGASHGDYDGVDPCDPSQNTPGVGWTYCWSEIFPQSGTLDDLSSGVSPVDSTDQVNNMNYLTPEYPLAGLIGCPLNGVWNIEICDDYGIDNGYIFNWSIQLDPILLPTGWSYNVPLDSVSWNGNFIISSNDSSATVFPQTGGGNYSYNLTVYDHYGCSYDTTFQIEIPAGPATPQIIESGGSLYSLTSGGNQWYDDSGIIPGETSQTFFPATSGNYYVIVTDANGCTSDTSNVIYVLITENSNLSSIKDLMISPNPVTTNLQIQTTLQINKVEITDITGRLLFTTTSKTIDCSGLKKGVCFVKVETTEGIAVKKFIKD